MPCLQLSSWHVSFIADNLRLLFLCGSNGRRGDITAGAVTQYEPHIPQLDHSCPPLLRSEKCFKCYLLINRPYSLWITVSYFSRSLLWSRRQRCWLTLCGVRGECDLHSICSTTCSTFSGLDLELEQYDQRQNIDCRRYGGESLWGHHHLDGSTGKNLVLKNLTENMN